MLSPLKMGRKRRLFKSISNLPQPPYCKKRGAYNIMHCQIIQKKLLLIHGLALRSNPLPGKKKGLTGM